MFKCKRCGAPTISLFSKYKAGIWRDIYCDGCHARMAANPIILGAFHFLAYVQMTAWFIGVAYVTHDMYNLLYIVPFWILFDIINVWLVPLVVLKPKPAVS